MRLARGDVPPQLKDVSLLTLDIGLLQAGASMKGEFEQRLRQVIDEVQASPKPIILFIDEIHTLVGAGGAAGTGRRGQPAQAGAGARQPAHHRRHHLGRIQEVHREGSRADPALPGGAGARAGRGQGDPDAARRREHAGEPSSRAAARPCHRGGGAAVASLHSGAAVARQGGEPARHGLCAGRGQPACDAAGGRGLHAPHRRPRDRGAHHRQGVRRSAS